ncbi:MAG: PEP-utilizing enzyme [Candidatus Woesearchaeota archaeon]
MPQAIITIGDHEDQILHIVKGKFNLKNKSDAINFIINKFEENLEGGIKPSKEARYLDEKNDPWMLGEEIPDMTFFFAKIWLNCFVKEFAHPSGRAYKKILAVFKGANLIFYFGEKDSFKVGENILNKFLTNPEFAERVNKQIVIEADKLRKFAKTIPETGIQQLSNEELNHYYQEHEKVHREYYQWCWIPVAVDMFHNNLTDAVKNKLSSKGLSEEKTNEYFITLTQPNNKSLIQIEQEEFLQIALEIQKNTEQRELFNELYKAFLEQEASPYGLNTHTKEYEESLENKVTEIKNKISPEIYKKIEDHYKKCFYVKFMWRGKDGVHSFNHYIKELVKFIGRKSDAKTLLSDIAKEQKKFAEKKEKLIKELKLEPKWITIFDSFGEFMVTKIYRRYAQIYAVYRMDPILKEIARKFNLSHLQVTFMTTQEVENALLRDEIDPQELQKRTELSVYYGDRDTEVFLTGIEAKRVVEKIAKKEAPNVSEFKGQTGCPGKARGIVKIIIRPEDMPKMNQGDILVSIATDPDIVPAMKKAAAFITEQGGVTSHAAIVAREMNTPCVIGTKIATRVLKDGDLVEVDASKGLVKILEKAK